MARSKAQLAFLKRTIDRTIPAAMQRGTLSALNKMAAQVRTQVIRELAEQIGLPPSKVRPYVRVRRAMPRYQESSVAVKPHTFNIASFGGRQTKKGVSSKAWGKRRIYKHTFLIHGRTAMIRVTKERFPIRPVWGPRLHKEFTREENVQNMRVTVGGKLPALIRHEINYALNRAGFAT